MVIINTRAAEVSIHALSPFSIFGRVTDGGVLWDGGGVSVGATAVLADGVVVG
jgi:hypothetical protein